jgi:hypothetical protein
MHVCVGRGIFCALACKEVDSWARDGSEIPNFMLITSVTRGNSMLSSAAHMKSSVMGDCISMVHALSSRTTYVFEIAKNSFCPSGGTLADKAVTSLRFSSIWLRTLLFSCNTIMPYHALNIHSILHVTFSLTA